MRINIILRDLTFFLLLIALARVAFNRAIEQQTEKEVIAKYSPTHQLDSNFLKNIKQTRKKVNRAVKTAHNRKKSKIIKKLKEITTDLDKIETKYKKNTPATFMLGPIGTTAIVLKEKELEKKLHKITNQIEALSDQISSA